MSAMARSDVLIRTVANGFVVTPRPDPGMMSNPAEEYVFSTSKELGDWIAENLGVINDES